MICTDKTGTLTLNQLRVEELDWLERRLTVREWSSETFKSDGQILFLLAIRHAHSLSDSRVTKTTLGDPLERALVLFAQNHDHTLPDAQRLTEIPFDDARRRQSVIVRSNESLWLLTKGAPEVIADLCDSTIDNQAEAQPIAMRRTAILGNAEKYAEQGFKVLAYACRKLRPETMSQPDSPNLTSFPTSEMLSPDMESNLVFLGLVSLADPLREEVPAAVEACRAAGLRVIMITGDHPQTARYVACHAGIFRNPQARIITGRELEHWSDTQLQLALGLDEIGFARVDAIQKLRIVRALQEKNEIVAVTGDGVNDAPALHSAHVGIAMGLCGTDVARESADVILLDDNFASIVAGVQEGRGIFKNIRNFMTYILASNVPEAVPLILYAFLPIPIPLNIPQILAIDLGTDMLPAIGLGSEPSETQPTDESKRKTNRRILSAPLMLKAYFWLGAWQAVAAVTMFFTVLSWNGWSWGQPIAPDSPTARQAATATFISVIIMQIANVFICRGRTAVIGRSALTNRIIISGVFIEILLIPVFLYVPVAQSILNTAPLPLIFFPFILLFMFIFMGAEKIRRISAPRLFKTT